LTFQELQNDVLAHHFSSAQYLQIAKDKINEAQLEVARRMDLRVLEASALVTYIGTGANTFDVATLATDFLRMRWFKDENLDVVIPPYPGGADAFITDGLRDDLSEGGPEGWAPFGTSIYFWPRIPESNYQLTLYYYKRPATLSGNSDVPAIPTDLHSALALYAVAKCFEHEGDGQQAQYFQAQFDRKLGEARVDYQWDMQDSRTVQVPGAWST